MLVASVIIPTYNREESLRKTLNSLSNQSLQANCYEVIVVDDGSTDNTGEIRNIHFPYSLNYIYQSNQGSAIARNTGAKEARSPLLIFIDDDILVEPAYISGLIQIHNLNPRVIGMGTFLPFIPDNATIFTKVSSKPVENNQIHPDGSFVDFTDCVTNNLSVEQNDFIEIGMMEDVAGDGPTLWGDVDFGYRAFRLGFLFFRSSQAKCLHVDYSILDLPTACSRARKCAQTAVFLFQKYPELRYQIPMFLDKLPINWSDDDPRLVARKLARRTVSSNPILSFMIWVAKLLETHYQSSSLLGPLYRWIIGSHMYQGYHHGTREHGII
jgi:glycosyltransferase involved in cell wall biosynthesis